MVQNPANQSGMVALRAYVQQLKDNYALRAISKGDTEFDKGQCNAMESLLKDMKHIMSDTETETGQ